MSSPAHTEAHTFQIFIDPDDADKLLNFLFSAQINFTIDCFPQPSGLTIPELLELLEKQYRQLTVAHNKARNLLAQKQYPDMGGI